VLLFFSIQDFSFKVNGVCLRNSAILNRGVRGLFLEAPSSEKYLVHPLAHLLVGALVGAVAPHPAASLLGGIASHVALDAVPHTEEETFTRGRRRGYRLSVAEDGAHHRRLKLTPGLIVAAVELIAGILIIAWLITRCHGLSPWAVGLGALGGVLPDLVDAPAHLLFRIRLMHVSKLHWTVPRRYALWGILTQVIAAGAAVAFLRRIGGCG
jgi:hypothetical protein